MTAPTVRDGTCPECGSTETLLDGLIPPHAVLLMTKAGERRSGQPCDGSNRTPTTARPGRPAKAPCGTKAAKRRHHDRQESCAECGYVYRADRQVAA